MRDKDVYEVIEQAEREITSLRQHYENALVEINGLHEVIKQKNEALDSYYPLAAEANTLKEECALLKEALKELIDSVENLKYIGSNNLPLEHYHKHAAIVNHAKDLLSPQG